MAKGKQIKAFPSHSFEKVNCIEVLNPINEGMDLRDYFAGQALTRSDIVKVMDINGNYREPKEIAKQCYGIADAMMAEREVKNGGK